MPDSRDTAAKPRIYLANSAFKKQGYDFDATVKAAARAGFAGAQLYIDARAQSDPARLERVAAVANEAGLSMLVHLPPVVSEATAHAARALLRFEARPRAIAHFERGKPLPAIDGIEVGLENAVRGFDPDYYHRLTAERLRGSRFHAFDVPSLFARAGARLDFLYAIAATMLDSLRDDDVLHLIDRRRLGHRRRDWCVLGKGLLAPLLPRIAAFRGTIVLEYETLWFALRGKRLLEESRSGQARSVNGDALQRIRARNFRPARVS